MIESCAFCYHEAKQPMNYSEFTITELASMLVGFKLCNAHANKLEEVRKEKERVAA